MQRDTVVDWEKDEMENAESKVRVVDVEWNGWIESR